MQLIVDTSDKFPFAREEIEELAKLVEPEELKANQNLEVNIIDEPGRGYDSEIQNLGNHKYIIRLGAIGYGRTKSEYKPEEEPYRSYRPEEYIKQGYLPYIEYEQTRDELAAQLAHEMKHIEQFEEEIAAGRNSGTKVWRLKKHETEADKYALEVLNKELRGLREEG